MSDIKPGQRVKVHEFVGEVTYVGSTGAVRVLLADGSGAAIIPPSAAVERLPDPERWEPDNHAWIGFDGVLRSDGMLRRPLTPLVRNGKPVQPERREPKVGDTVRIVGNRNRHGTSAFDRVGQTLRVEQITDTEVILRVGPMITCRRLSSEVEVIDAPEHRLYKVGDPDPAPAARARAGSDKACGARSRDLRYGIGECTWPPGHDHPQHVAGTGREIVAVWPVEPTP